MNSVSREVRLKNIFCEIFHLSESTILENLEKDTIELWDSLGHLELIMAVEEEFKIKFSSGKIPLMVSFATILDEINVCMSHQNLKEG